MTAIGCVADDYTGGTDVASALRRAGLRVVLLFGPPPFEGEPPECDALVVALKSRTIAADRAVAESLQVHRWLEEHGVQQVYFKHCSTFDSTDAGNIGPVTDALLDADDAPLTLICPSSPEHGRSVFQGHLFVGDSPLSQSSMRHHPLTPMTDSNLVRLMNRQTTHPVALIPLQVVRAGAHPFQHAALYRSRPVAGAVVHLHSTYSVAVSCLDGLNSSDVLPPLTAYYVMRVGRLPLLPYHAPGDDRLGLLAERTAEQHHAFLPANHGPVVAAADLSSAADAIKSSRRQPRSSSCWTATAPGRSPPTRSQA